MFKVIDTHTHFDAEEFDEDRAEAFARAKDCLLYTSRCV